MNIFIHINTHTYTSHTRTNTCIPADNSGTPGTCHRIVCTGVLDCIVLAKILKFQIYASFTGKRYQKAEC